MNTTERLNAIIPRITEENFIQGKGLGNEIPFHIFDYPPKEELKVREYVLFIIDQMAQKHKHVRILHIKLFDLMVEYLRSRGNLDKAFTLEVEKGSQAIWNALSASVKPDRFIKMLNEKYHLADHDIIFISGVGTIWPWVRAHSLLNNLQSITGNASVVLFYPGMYNGLSLTLFGMVQSNPYYRAFRLVP